MSHPEPNVNRVNPGNHFTYLRFFHSMGVESISLNSQGPMRIIKLIHSGKVSDLIA